MKTIAGFLTADGGVLLVEIGDDGEVTGIVRPARQKPIRPWPNLTPGPT
jgi:hypothetical protein